MGGKFIACLSGISAFVAIGLEHCIANMVSALPRPLLRPLTVCCVPVAGCRCEVSNRMPRQPSAALHVQVFVPLGVITGVPGVTWEKFIFNNLIPGD